MKSVIAIALLSVGVSGLAMAAPDDNDVMDINGSVSDTCFLGTPVVSASSDASLASKIVTFSALADTSTAVFTGGGSSIELNFDGMCNYAHNVSIQSTNGWLINSSSNTVVAGSGSFNSTVGYTPTVKWHNQLATFNADDGSAGKKASKPILGAFAGIAELQINLIGVDDPAAPLVAGTYTDDLVLQLGAAL